MFYTKNKVVRGFHTLNFTKASPWTLWGAYSSPRPPAAINQCAHIFSVLSPDIFLGTHSGQPLSNWAWMRPWTEIERLFLAARGFNTNLVQFLWLYHVIISNVHIYSFTCTISCMESHVLSLCGGHTITYCQCPKTKVRWLGKTVKKTNLHSIFQTVFTWR